jgi:hypothetical protein
MPQTLTHLPQDLQRCIEECQQCHAACLATVNHCLDMGGPHADPAHIGLLLDCAQICQTSADFMLRMSDRHHVTCRVCAEVCRACAEDCERLAGGDAMMRECAEQCRRCRASCERMAA